MATLKEIKKRVTSVKNTQKITNAMKLVSSAKFTKANRAVRGARPYLDAVAELTSQLVTGIDHPLLREQKKGRVLVVLFSSDRGLCGALNANLLKFVVQQLTASVGQHFRQQVDFIVLGKKAEQFCQRHKFTIISSQHNIEQRTNNKWRAELWQELARHFKTKTHSRVYLAYQLFVSALKQTPVWQQVLPLDISETGRPRQYLIEPTFDHLLEVALAKYAANQIQRAVLNSVASEHRARMNAMDNATNNAKKVVKELTLQYNRGRQAAITKELIEIVAGVQAI